MKMTKATWQSIVIYRPDRTIRFRSTCAWTKATSFRGIGIMEEYGYTIHIRLKREGNKVALKKEYQNTELDDGLLKEPILT